jgi:hypothetical protein
LRRLITIGTALAVLGAAAAAYAATHFNNYSGSNLAITKGAGTKAKPVALGMVQNLVANSPAGDRAAPLTDVKFKIYGVKLDWGKLPVCTDAKILQNKTNPDGGCPAGSVIGDGPVHSLLGPSTSPSTTGAIACNPYLRIFNGGPHTQVLYFYTKAATDCGGLTTGATAPYDASISYSHGWAVIDIPQPPDVSTKVANQPGLYGSLTTETITFAKKVNGKVYMAGIGCKKGKRLWSITFTAQNYDGSSDTQTVTGKRKC